MGRNKLEIKKIGTTGGRQITYSKRRVGIMKKARELSILCDVDVLLIVFSTSGKPSICLGEKSTFEEVIQKYAAPSPQERNKRKHETIEALKKTFKKVDHRVNIDQLDDQPSQQVEEAKQQLLACKNEIAQLCPFLGPLVELENIDEIEDINKIILMEHKLNDSITQNRVFKEHAKNNTQMLKNQHYQLNGELNPLYYTAPDGQIMVTCNNPMAPQRDPAKYNTTEYEDPINYATQDIPWPQMNGIQKIFTDELPGLMHHSMDTPHCRENIKMDEIPENQGGVNGNWIENQNRFIFQDQDETFNINMVLKEAGGLHLQEISENGTDVLVDTLFEQNSFLHKDHVNQLGVTMPDFDFQAWTSGNDDGFFA